MGIMVLGTSVSAQEITDLSQNEIDHNSIITSCLTFSHLDAKVPSVAINDLEEYEILNHGVEFNFSSNLKVNNRDVSLISKGEAFNGTEPFFLFHTIRINDSKAFVKYYLEYKMGGQVEAQSVEISFVKEENEWIVENYSL